MTYDELFRTLDGISHGDLDTESRLWLLQAVIIMRHRQFALNHDHIQDLFTIDRGAAPNANAVYRLRDLR